MATITEILKFPTLIDNNHESLYRSYHILNLVLKMIERGDSKETIFETVEFIKESPRENRQEAIIEAKIEAIKSLDGALLDIRGINFANRLISELDNQLNQLKNENN
jgi:hypothetical protein